MRLNIINRIIGAILLISGTSIGAGMLGLPIKTIGVNFLFVLAMFFIILILMFFAAIAMLEISLWLSENTNIISISNFVFGKYFSFVIGIIYVCFLYSLIAAYISGGSTMLADLLVINYESYFYSVFFSFIFILPFFLIVFLGINFSDYINRIFFILLILLYFFLTFNLTSFLEFRIVDFNFLDKSLLIFSMPIIVTSFGYSLLIPSLKIYLFNNIKFLLIAIIIGSLIPFFVYVIWEYFIYSFLFNISNKLFVQTLFGYGNPADKLIVLIGNNNIVVLYVISFFSLIALISSLIGVALSLYDFFFDFLQLQRFDLKHRFFVSFLVFLIPFFLSLIFLNGFMIFLSYAGAFASVLLIIFPTYTLWYGRYIKNFNYKYVLFGGKFMLFILLIFGFLVFFVDLFYKYFV